MNFHHNTFSLRHAVKACALVAALTLGTAAMRADTINFAGSSTGGFDGGASASTATLSTLTYYGSTFNDVTSTWGFLAFGGDGVQNQSNFNNFGSFQLSNANATFSDTFKLMLTFTNPTGISSGQNTNFDAIVFGQVSGTNNGGVQVAFSPSSQAYTFSNGMQTGSFTLNVNNVSVNPGQLASLTGYIMSSATSAITPEPSSLMLLGTGLIGSAGIVFRRRLV